MKSNQVSRRQTRGNPFLKEQVHDPYHAQGKLPGGTRCPQCGAKYESGRWVWAKGRGKVGDGVLCPACRRIKDRYPAGEAVLTGSFLSAHKGDILATARNIAEAENKEHPLHRIIAIDEESDRITITTTDVHLPHRIAHALKDAFGGSIKTHYDVDGYFTRASWERSD